MDNLDLFNEVSIEVDYVDEHLLELEVIVKAGQWRGQARAYTIHQDIAAFSVALQRFADGKAAVAEFVAGADNGSGMIGLPRIFHQLLRKWSSAAA